MLHRSLTAYKSLKQEFISQDPNFKDDLCLEDDNDLQFWPEFFTPNENVPHIELAELTQANLERNVDTLSNYIGKMSATENMERHRSKFDNRPRSMNPAGDLFSGDSAAPEHLLYSERDDAISDDHRGVLSQKTPIL